MTEAVKSEAAAPRTRKPGAGRKPDPNAKRPFPLRAEPDLLAALKAASADDIRAALRERFLPAGEVK